MKYYHIDSIWNISTHSTAIRNYVLNLNFSVASLDGVG